ncbi:exported hypothetical protein [Paraburkholderia piptadeniae]|uniref:Uncharacterized protein n=1 Tax=Paraburkholderia piptadeniae TaxID=1701573 RepID=A0A1N7SPS7_9BURK|nr:exported hypothetical protein [Paraburkholderia piptadeniae]
MAWTGLLANLIRLYQKAFTASLNALPAVNFTVLAAGIAMVSPVDGLRPLRAAREPLSPMVWITQPGFMRSRPFLSVSRWRWSTVPSPTSHFP